MAFDSSQQRIVVPQRDLLAVLALMESEIFKSSWRAVNGLLKTGHVDVALEGSSTPM